MVESGRLKGFVVGVVVVVPVAMGFKLRELYTNTHMSKGPLSRSVSLSLRPTGLSRQLRACASVRVSIRVRLTLIQ